MPRLLLLRHAKSGWAQPGMLDFDRPLDEVGRAESEALARRLQSQDLKSSAVYCSPALRTRQTAEIVFGGRSEVNFVEKLYSADAQFYLDTAKEAGDAEVAIIVGHNPMTEELALALAKRGSADAMSALRGGYPTCGLAMFSFEGSFADLDAKGTYLDDFIRPSP